MTFWEWVAVVSDLARIATFVLSVLILLLMFKVYRMLKGD